jgi:tetratricopeptide (TPR) repeat protein
VRPLGFQTEPKPEQPEAWGNKGVAMEALGRLDEAIQAYRKAAELKADHVDALANLGNALSRKGLHEEDLVIAVDTSVAHLAGALAVPVWVAMPLACDWRWLLDREDTPWYPTMRLFRQRDLGDWDDVVGRMADALRERVASDAPAEAEPPEAERLSA